MVFFPCLQNLSLVTINLNVSTVPVSGATKCQCVCRSMTLPLKWLDIYGLNLMLAFSSVHRQDYKTLWKQTLQKIITFSFFPERTKKHDFVVHVKIFLVSFVYVTQFLVIHHYINSKAFILLQQCVIPDIWKMLAHPLSIEALTLGICFSFKLQKS